MQHLNPKLMCILESLTICLNWHGRHLGGTVIKGYPEEIGKVNLTKKVGVPQK